ncbi:acyltransferase family protein [Mycolicibacterium sp. 050158]|uniref:acyltransferase family protein n=1 Tax=Mycolicibacterium sp. 050158 TaxID=3090602 RepID=UPI00299D8FF4|nr:acyltransferase family protein [Mycolicibacterium sp. 050158]MDX1888193.1 acyltransferase family protein [Mycolicibacterium sp. 050158]
MATVWQRYDLAMRRRRADAEAKHQRLDVQGLRMVAILTVFANHLWGWPQGGFVGVDVFFVISGFLITGNLLRNAEITGTVSFRGFYWNRIRRIVPAATLVLILTCVASALVFQPFRAHQVGTDALWAFVFWANWHFLAQGTDYFHAGTAVSPIQHYWSLSIEEQFYFLWPALIFAISVLIVSRRWSHSRRNATAGAVMALIVVTSLSWALYETATAPVAAYFNTFARVWELGVGALLATAIGPLARIPRALRPLLSWGGLLLIGASLFLIRDGSTAFPAPWAVLPVCGAAMVITAGVGGEPPYQALLRNPISTYIGDISYSLYLVHWPVIVLVGALMDVGPYYYISATTLSFALAIASYHGVENPLRRADARSLQVLATQLRRRRYWPTKSSQYAALGACTLLVIAMSAFALQPLKAPTAPPDIAVAASSTGDDDPTPAGNALPLGSALHDQIVAALKATNWPQFEPSIEEITQAPAAVPEVLPCGGPIPPPVPDCTWGDPSAPTKAVLLGDSVAMAYLGPLMDIAVNSGGKLQVHNEAQFACYFIDDPIANDDQALADACPDRKRRAVDYINDTKPDIVFISHTYTDKKVNGANHVMSAREWGVALSKFIESFRGSVKKIVFLAPPPADKVIGDCYGKRASTPADCISRVSGDWRRMKNAEQGLAQIVGGVWIDSRPWFCAATLCPSFVENILTKRDAVHMSQPYGKKIEPAINETLLAAGLL